MNRIARTIAAGALAATAFGVAAAGPAEAADDVVSVTVDSTGIDAQIDLPTTEDVNGWE